MNTLSIDHISKSYGKKTALKDFSYTFTDGIYGLLGPNGAGKSTMMNIITDNIRTDTGTISFNGKNRLDNPAEYRSLIGYVPQQQQVYKAMTLERFLYYMAALKGIDKKESKQQLDYILKAVHLEDVRNVKMGTFSGGMKQRALIAQAILGNPRLLILDEPTAGLDPKERIRIRNLIMEIAFDRIVIVSTHLVEDIEMIAKELVFLKEGECILHGTYDEVLNTVNEQAYMIHAPMGEWKQICDRNKVSSMTREKNFVALKVITSDSPCEGWVRTPMRLEDVYLALYE